jgi:hypothetical protein
MIPLGLGRPLMSHPLQISRSEMMQVLAHLREIELHQLWHLEMVLGPLIPMMHSRD